MQIYLLIAALIAVLAVIFALQNAVPITVSFLLWQVNSSLALILIVAFIAGVITSFLFNFLSHLRKNRKLISLEKPAEESK
ncbi:MAG TPA: LapA family protein, partial [Atribacterota bacterium]|nr:LapA family protein [Atribacterota bacterium]HOR41569.1 LapA family protein [Atribacterota bacterium]HPK87461.1 LapA family protein [Atribacterota bacterium]